MGAKGRPATSGTWQKGRSGNPSGAPKRGESWADIIRKLGDMTGEEAAGAMKQLSADFRRVGGGVTLKQAVVLRVYHSLLFDPQPGLLNAFMDRAEGKPVQPVFDATELLRKARAAGLTDDDLSADPILAELFAASGVHVSVGHEAQAVGGTENPDE